MKLVFFLIQKITTTIIPSLSYLESQETQTYLIQWDLDVLNALHIFVYLIQLLKYNCMCACESHSVVSASLRPVHSKALGAPPSIEFSSIHGIFQARILELIAIPFSRASSWPKLRSLALQADSLPSEPPGKPLYTTLLLLRNVAHKG